MDHTNFAIFFLFQVIAVVILFLAALFWSAKKGNTEMVFVFGAVSFVVVGIAIYCTLLTIAGFLVFFEIISIPNNGFVYLGFAVVSGILSGTAWNWDIWK